MQEAYFINEHGVRISLYIPENSVDKTDSFNSSRTVALLIDQHKEQCELNKQQRKHNLRMFIISVITSFVSLGALIVSIVTLISH